MKNIILYGAGKRGRAMYAFLKSKGANDIITGFCDKKHDEIQKVDDLNVYGIDEVRGKGYLFCITLLDENGRRKIKDTELVGEKCIDFSDIATHLECDKITFNREFCAFYHCDDMEKYYEDAEDNVDVFWNENSEFYKMFCMLDLTNVIELACGRGRHVPMYLEKAGRVTLVDILEKNLDACRKRFADASDKIYYYANDGYDLRKLEDSAYSSLFTYDAMVHFEMMDIYSYLKDIYRYLKPGGRALFHHSNYTKNYKANFCNAPHSRNFMSRNLFAYLAYRVGFNVLIQKEIDWFGTPKLDCVTLLEKEM